MRSLSGADSHLIATMGADEAVNVTNLSTGQLLAHLTGHTAPVNAAEFSADNRRLYTSSSDGTVISWDIANLNDLGTELSTPTPRTSVFTENVMTSRTGELAVQYSDGTIRIWGTQDAPPSSPVLVSHSEPTGGSFSPDGHLLVVADASGAIRLIDVSSRRVVATLAHLSHGAFDPEFSPNARYIAVVGDDGNAILIDTATRRPIGTPFAVLDHPRDVAWSPDSRKIAVDSPDNSELAAYDVQTSSRAASRRAITHGVVTHRLRPRRDLLSHQRARCHSHAAASGRRRSHRGRAERPCDSPFPGLQPRRFGAPASTGLPPQRGTAVRSPAASQPRPSSHPQSPTRTRTFRLASTGRAVSSSPPAITAFGVGTSA